MNKKTPIDFTSGSLGNDEDLALGIKKLAQACQKVHSLEVIVTSGGTIVNIDDVRNIGNKSRGTTGAKISEELLKRGAVVHYVYAQGAKQPFRMKLTADPHQPIDNEIKKISQEHALWNKYSKQLKEYQYQTFDDYYDIVKELVTTTSSNVIVLAAAVSDYKTKEQTGKVSSDRDSIAIELEKAPKIISLIKKWNPKIYQVGFKLLSRSSMKELIDTAYKAGIKNRSNLTVANTLIGGDFGKRATVLITPEKGLITTSMEDLGVKLADTLLQRVSRCHYKTQVTIDSSYQKKFKQEIMDFRKDIQKLWSINMFEEYHSEANMHFGFLARRVNNGFLITSRGSNKREMPMDDIVYVKNVNAKEHIVDVVSTGKKASLNANVAGQLFTRHSNINTIIHGHIFPGVKNQTAIDYSPGTQEDVDTCVAGLEKDKIVELKNHGIIAMGEDIASAIATLYLEPAYRNFARSYDLIYHRFQKSSDFIDLILKEVVKDAAILDLAAGTGEVALQLHKNGYNNITLADKNQEMLNVAIEKMPDITTYVSNMIDLQIDKKFDAIVVRQAINYAMDYDRLVCVFKGIHEHLNDDGKIIFNAPNYIPGQIYKDKEINDEINGWNIYISERNLVEQRIITHTQHCTLVKCDGSEIKKLYDLNRFGLFNKEDFSNALNSNGFSAKFYSKGLNEYNSASKSLYIVGKK